jgi:hypothetical protein
MYSFENEGECFIGKSGNRTVDILDVGILDASVGWTSAVSMREHVKAVVGDHSVRDREP